MMRITWNVNKPVCGTGAGNRFIDIRYRATKGTRTTSVLSLSLLILASNVLVSRRILAETPAARGECIEAPEVYLKELSSVINKNPRSKSDRYYITSRLFCLYNDSRFTLASKYPDGFASVGAMEEIRSENKKSRDACFKVIRRFLQSTGDIRCDAIKALAYFGDPRAASLLIGCNDINPADKATLLAIAGNRRAIPWILKQYEATETLTGETRTVDAATMIHRKKVYLNALFHLGTRAQLPFIDEVIRTEKSDEIKERAKVVKAHIEEFPRN
jgi:hypothetical protein